MKLRIIYDPVLRQKAHPVELFDSGLKAYATEMIEIMKSHNGLGLAANQVGLDKRLIVFGYEPKNKETIGSNGAKLRGEVDDLPRIPFTALVNPVLIKASKEKTTMTEGCLSLPGLELPVVRSAGVVVSAQDLTGQTVTIKAKGLLARILQHEIDHLDGVLFTDRADSYSDLADYKFAKIVFFGSDDFSLPTFTALVDSGLNVVAAVTETDKPAGRGRELGSTLIKTAASQAGIAVFQPSNKAEIVKLLTQIQPDLIVLASYGKILPAAALELPTYGALNVHPSLLPKYRGATPIQAAILDGEPETGVTIMSMTPIVDAGGMLSQYTEPIKPDDTAASLKIRLAALGAKLLLKQLPIYLAGQATIKGQDEAVVSLTTKLTKEMGEVDWSRPIELIDRQIRALQPWPGAYTWLEGKRLKLLGSYLQDNQLVLTSVQLEGKKPSAWADFRRGYLQALKKTDWYGKIS